MAVAVVKSSDSIGRIARVVRAVGRETEGWYFCVLGQQ